MRAFLPILVLALAVKFSEQAPRGSEDMGPPPEDSGDRSGDGSEDMGFDMGYGYGDRSGSEDMGPPPEDSGDRSGDGSEDMGPAPEDF